MRTRVAVPALSIALQASVDPPSTHEKATSAVLAREAARVQASAYVWFSAEGMQIFTAVASCERGYGKEAHSLFAMHANVRGDKVGLGLRCTRYI